jgi:prepilin-type N-terminal cleavage/methylation domain-containing protein
MKFNSKSLFRSAKGLAQPAGTHGAGRRQRQAGFTLTEIMIVMVLLTILLISSFTAIYFNTQASFKLADRTAIVSLVRAKLEAVRAASYNPPDTNFKSTPVYLTNSHSIALNKAGTAFLVSGTITTKIEEAKSGTNTVGHLVTATGTFVTAGKPISVQLQTVVNKFSGGQQ